MAETRARSLVSTVEQIHRTDIYGLTIYAFMVYLKSAKVHGLKIEYWYVGEWTRCFALYYAHRVFFIVWCIVLCCIDIFRLVVYVKVASCAFVINKTE